MNPTTETPYRGWQYAELGDYHRTPDPNWSYTPTYLRKTTLVTREVGRLVAPGDPILDVGCGEGVFVERLKADGYDIEGLDLNYESEWVKRGSVLDMPYADGSMSMVLLLDVFEHLAFADQANALSEIWRVLRPEGHFLATIPNLAHWNSRFAFTFSGQLDRTDVEIDHCGERPYVENVGLLKAAGFEIRKTVGITLTVPFLYRALICRWPARLRWLHDALEPLAVPSLAMLNLFVCRKAARVDNRAGGRDGSA